MRNYPLTKCLLGWAALVCATSASRHGTIGFVDGAVTRADTGYGYADRSDINARRFPLERRSSHSTHNFSEDSNEQTYLYLNDRGEAQTAIELLESRLRYVFGSKSASKQQRKKAKKSTKFWIKPDPFRISTVRQLDNVYNYDDDKHKYVDDDQYNNNDQNNDDAGGNDAYKSDDLVSAADERCSAFLVSFLEGTTDAHDTCEGMMNAYTAAGEFNHSSFLRELHRIHATLTKLFFTVLILP
jgi:hypothetical protein